MLNKSFVRKTLLSLGLITVSASAITLTSCGGKVNPFLDLDPKNPDKSDISLSMWEQHIDLQKASEIKLDIAPPKIVTPEQAAALISSFTVIDGYWELAHFMANSVGAMPSSTKAVFANIDNVIIDTSTSSISAKINIPDLGIEYDIVNSVDLVPLVEEHRVRLGIGSGKLKFISYRFYNIYVS